MRDECKRLRTEEVIEPRFEKSNHGFTLEHETEPAPGDAKRPSVAQLL